MISTLVQASLDPVFNIFFVYAVKHNLVLLGLGRAVLVSLGPVVPNGVRKHIASPIETRRRDTVGERGELL